MYGVLDPSVRPRRQLLCNLLGLLYVNCGLHSQNFVLVETEASLTASFAFRARTRLEDEEDKLLGR
jgi:hypothetical protein